MNFMKLFQKMVTLLYKLDVISEDVIIMWYKTGHIPKGNDYPSKLSPEIIVEVLFPFLCWL